MQEKEQAYKYWEKNAYCTVYNGLKNKTNVFLHIACWCLHYETIATTVRFIIPIMC